MATIQVRVYRPVKALEPGSVVYVTEDEFISKMIELGHLERVYPGEDAEPEPQSGPA